MSRVVLDASALLAFLLAEAGADVVARRLRHASLSAVNYAETLARLAARGKRLDEAAADIARLQLNLVPFDETQAVVAASLRAATRELGLSLGDRCCLALGLTTGLAVLTADQDWARLDIGVAVEVIRPAPVPTDTPPAPPARPRKTKRPT